MKLTRLALPIALVAVFAACGDDETASTSTSEPSTPDVTLPEPDDDSATDNSTAIDGPWVLVAGSVDGADVALLDGYDVTLTIEGDRIGGTAACNGYGGTVSVADGSFLVGDLSWTEMGCEPDVMSLEQLYLQSLPTVTSHVVIGGELMLAGPTAEWTFARLEPVDDAAIVGTTWVLDTYLDGDSATNMPMMDLAFLSLDADGSFTGTTSCRRLTGEWIESGATIRFPSFQALEDPTAGACAPESETLDGLIISVLEGVESVDVDGDRLTLMASGNQGLSYVVHGP